MATSNDEIIPLEVMPNIVLPQLDINIDYKPYNVRILCLDSPHSFFVHLRTDYDIFISNLTTYYNSLDDSSFNNVIDLPTGSTWVVHYDGLWFRAVVIKKLENYLPIHFKMMFVDYGFVRNVKLEDIRYLNENFSFDSPFAIHCSLAEVYPLMKWNYENPWSEDAKNYFSEFCCQSEELKAIFIKKFKDKNKYEVLIESLNGEVLNEELVKRGFATSTIIESFDDRSREIESLECEGSKDLIKTKAIDDPSTAETIDPDWNPMAEEYERSSNMAYVDKNSAELVLNGFENDNAKKICRSYMKYQRCRYGDLCRWEHILPRSDGLCSGSTAAYSNLETNRRLPDVGGCFFAVVAVIFSPSNFYIQYPYSEKGRYGKMLYKDSFKELQKDLNEHYLNTFASIQSALPSIGELMVVKGTKSPLEGFFRVRILQLEDKDDGLMVKVFYIDVGQTEWTEEKNLRSLATQFLHTPIQALNCYLSAIAPPSNGWGKKARDFMVNSINNKVVTIYISERSEYFEDKIGVVLDIDEEMSVNEALVHADLAAVSNDLY